ncbi:hypothetical protein PG996_010012 [Apiospora saccharicola]|uniref:Uncharacterized protein n=1 Tax=Apiospora saccharicola TaxID=335842 RepID=A0ABR1UN20_9PEZI
MPEQTRSPPVASGPRGPPAHRQPPPSTQVAPLAPVLHLRGWPVVILSSLEAARDLLPRRGTRSSDRPRMLVAVELALKGMHMLAAVAMTRTGRYLVDSFPDLNRIPFLAGFVTPWKREAEAHFQRQCDLHGGSGASPPPDLPGVSARRCRAAPRLKNLPVFAFGFGRRTYPGRHIA